LFTVDMINIEVSEQFFKPAKVVNSTFHANLWKCKRIL